MSAMRRMPQLARLINRRFGTSSARSAVKAEDTKAFKKLKEEQVSFNTGMGPEEVFLQGGLKDLLLYRTTVFLTVVSTLYAFKCVYVMAQK